MAANLHMHTSSVRTAQAGPRLAPAAAAAVFFGRPRPLRALGALLLRLETERLRLRRELAVFLASAGRPRPLRAGVAGGADGLALDSSSVGALTATAFARPRPLRAGVAGVVICCCRRPLLVGGNCCPQVGQLEGERIY